MLPFVRNKADLIILREALREYDCEDRGRTFRRTTPILRLHRNRQRRLRKRNAIIQTPKSTGTHRQSLQRTQQKLHGSHADAGLHDQKSIPNKSRSK